MSHDDDGKESPKKTKASKVECMTTKTFPPFLALDLEIRVALPTKEAAFHLNRSEQTLRLWACKQCGPLLPVRMNGRLAWPVAEIRRVMTGAA